MEELGVVCVNHAWLQLKPAAVPRSFRYQLFPFT